jgi:hypothetical protein
MGAWLGDYTLFSDPAIRILSCGSVTLRHQVALALPFIQEFVIFNYKERVTALILSLVRVSHKASKSSIP